MQRFVDRSQQTSLPLPQSESSSPKTKSVFGYLLMKLSVFCHVIGAFNGTCSSRRDSITSKIGMSTLVMFQHISLLSLMCVYFNPLLNVGHVHLSCAYLSGYITPFSLFSSSLFLLFLMARSSNSRIFSSGNPRDALDRKGVVNKHKSLSADGAEG